MSIDLKALSPKELLDIISDANAHMHKAHAAHVQTVREKIDALLKKSDLTLSEVYPNRVGKKAIGKKSGNGSVAPKYQDPSDPSVQWSGRGRQPLWFAKALRKRGVTAEHLLIGGAAKTSVSTKAAKKVAKKTVARRVAKR
jgi:DNA-binding protein H-NS